MIAMIIGGYIGQKFGLVYTYYITIIPFVIDFLILLMIKTNETIKNINIENRAAAGKGALHDTA